jgi:hypothetical protein
MNDIERVTSSTGGQKDRKTARFGGADPLALQELARVYGHGEQKYTRYNYLRGYDWSLSVDALFRHLFAFLAREERDPESGLLHMAHAAWHALTLVSFALRGVGTDDRVPAAPDRSVKEKRGTAPLIPGLVSDSPGEHGPDCPGCQAIERVLKSAYEDEEPSATIQEEGV